MDHQVADMVADMVVTVVVTVDHLPVVAADSTKVCCIHFGPINIIES